MAVLAVLIVVNVVLLFLLFRPDRALTAQPQIKTQGRGCFANGDIVASIRLHWHRRPKLPSPAPRQIRRPRLDQSSRLLSNGCSSPYLPRRLGGRLLATATPRQDRAVDQRRRQLETNRSNRSGSDRAARRRAKRRSLRHWRYRQSCSARYVAYANDGTVTASTTARSMCGSQLRRTATKSMGLAGQKPLHARVMSSALRRSASSRALVVCDNGAAMSTRNSGKTWRQVARIPDTLAIAAGSGQYWVAGAHEVATA